MWIILKNLYLRVSNTGVYSNMNSQLQKRVRLSNSLAFCVILTVFPICTISLLIGDFVNFQFNILVGILMAFSLLLNKAGMTYLARHTIITGVAIVGGIEHQIAGPLVAINHGYFAWLLLPFVMFEPKDRWHMISCVVMIGIFFIVSEFYRFPFFIGSEIAVERALISKLVMSVLFVFLIGFMAYLLVKENYIGEAKLESEKNHIQELNSQLIEQQKALVRASRMAALGEMASAMSHEINNPLAVIKMSSQQVVKLSDRGELTDKAKNSAIQKIEEAVSRITAIIAGLRRFSGENQSQLEYSDLYEAFENSLSLCRERFHEKGILLKIQDLRHFRVNMNTSDLQHVLYNVLTNVIEHSTQENNDDKWVSITFQDKGSNQVLLIENGGRPISQEIADRIFEPFFTTKEVGKGTGLGLASSKGIMVAHGGNLKLDTSTGRTCFILEFPLVRKEV